MLLVAVLSSAAHLLTTRPDPGRPDTISKTSKHPELAWELAKYLYYEKGQLGKRLAETYILPPNKDAWTLPEFDQASDFFSDQKLGQACAALAHYRAHG